MQINMIILVLFISKPFMSISLPLCVLYLVNEHSTLHQI